jgi:hypothetical protein
VRVQIHMKILWWDIQTIKATEAKQDLARQLVLGKPPTASLYLKYSNPKFLADYLKEVFPHRQVLHGKKNQGDIVIVGMEPNPHLTLEEYLKPLFPVEKIETKGIYTNIYLGRDFHTEILKKVTS